MRPSFADSVFRTLLRRRKCLSCRRRLVTGVGPGKPARGLAGDRGGVVADKLAARTVGAGSVRVTGCRAEQVGTSPRTVSANLERGKLTYQTGRWWGPVRVPGMRRPGCKRRGRLLKIDICASFRAH